MLYYIELLLNGLLIGSLYSLIALGFVLIYKASDVINFAQGELVMFSGYIVVAVTYIYGFPLWVGVIVGIIGMMGLGFTIQGVVLKHMIGRPVISMIMATIGLAFFLRGLAPFLWGIETKNLSLGAIEEIFPEPVFVLEALGISGVENDIMLQPLEILIALFSGVIIMAVSFYFQKSRSGLALRAIADDQQAALAMGVDVQRSFSIAWGLCGMMALAGGLVWGNLLGIDIQLALVGLKVFPVVILGGLDSLTGAIIGGLAIGVLESMAAGFIDPLVGGGTKDFTPYLVMILVLMIKPYGLFGKELIERV